MRIITIVFAIIFFWLQYIFWSGTNGMQDYLQIKSDVQLASIANKKLEKRNQQLYADIDDLKAGGEAIEERARNELGLIRSNETFYRIVEN